MLDYRLLYHATLGVDGQRHLLVLQHHLLAAAVERLVEEGGRVVARRFQCFCLSGGFGHLSCRFSLIPCHLGDGVLLPLGGKVCLRGLVVDAESNEHQSHQGKSDD